MMRAFYGVGLAVPFLLVACSGGGSSVATVATFSAPRGAPTNGASAQGLSLADLDHDGFADAIVADETLGAVIVLRGAADGGLGPGLVQSVSVDVADFALADLNGDRNLDLVVVSATAPDFSVFLGGGDATFAASSSGGLPWSAREVLLADVTGDGLVDLVATSRHTAEFAWLPGLGGGAFGPAVTIGLAYVPSCIVAADVDRDGRMDLVTVGAGGSVIDAWRGGGSGGLMPAVTSVVGPQVGVLAAADFDDDGRVDLAAVAATTGELLRLRGSGGGSFVAVDGANLMATGVDSLVAGDFDGDGWMDCGVAAGSDLRVVFGAGVNWRNVEHVTAGVGTVRSVAAHDLAGNGRNELLCVVANTQVVVIGSQLAAPAGLSVYGAGTPDCGGRIGMWANGSPRLGNRDYAYTVTNAPPSTFGWLLQGGPADVAGSDPFNIGVTLHIDLGLLIHEVIFSDGLGRARLPRPVPSDVGLVGLPIYVQTLWQGGLPGSCSLSPQGLSSSIGLISTVQP